MAIDADLNAGLITDEQARETPRGDRRRGRLLRRDGRRLEVRQRRRDRGASSSPSINLDRRHRRRRAAARHWRSAEATQHFSLLTVGDGLAAQIPALLISVATGIIVTRAASDTRPRLGHRQPDPRPAQGAAGRRRRDRRLRADPGAAEAAVPVHRRRSSARSPGPCATACRGRRGREQAAAAARRRRGAAAAPSDAALGGRRRRARARDRLRPRAARRRSAAPAARCCAG